MHRRNARPGTGNFPPHWTSRESFGKIGHPRTAQLGAEDDDVLGGFANDTELEAKGTVDVSDGELPHGVRAKPRGGGRVEDHGLAHDRQVAVELDEEQVSRESAGLVHAAPGVGAKRGGLPGGVLVFGQGAPEGAGAAHCSTPCHLDRGAGITWNNVSAADLTIAVLVADHSAGSAALGNISYLHIVLQAGWPAGAVIARKPGLGNLIRHPASLMGNSSISGANINRPPIPAPLTFTPGRRRGWNGRPVDRSEEHTSELQARQ